MLKNENMEVSAKQFFIELLEEIPKKTVLWNTMNGPLTAENIIEDLKSNGADSKQYIDGLMSLTRDVLIAKVKNKKV